MSSSNDAGANSDNQFVNQENPVMTLDPPSPSPSPLPNANSDANNQQEKFTLLLQNCGLTDEDFNRMLLQQHLNSETSQIRPIIEQVMREKNLTFDEVFELVKDKF